MGASSFTRKRLRVTFTLANDVVFEQTNSNVLTLEGLRVLASIRSAGAPIAPTCSLQVFGMRQADMNALTMLAWKPLALQRNELRVEADSGDGYTEVFSGQIIEAAPDYAAAPDVTLRVSAVSLYFSQIEPAPPTSYPGSVDVAVVCADLAKRMGKTFENNGVAVQLDRPYFANTLTEQFKSACSQAGIDYFIDGDTIAIAPRGAGRALPEVLLNAQSGLVGYPSIDTTGIQLQCLYRSGLRFGGPVQVESDVPLTNGRWYIYALDHALESENPNGMWHSGLSCSEFGRTVVR